MAAKNRNVLIIIAIVGIALFAFSGQKQLFAANQPPTSITRDVPSEADTNSQFKISYEPNGGSGKWGVSIVDELSGNCEYNGGKEIKQVFLSEGREITVDTGSEGECTISGNYKINDENPRNFQDDTVRVKAGGDGDDGDDGNGDNGDGDENGGEDTKIVKFIKKIGRAVPLTKDPLIDGLIILLGGLLVGMMIISKIGKK